MPGGDTFGVGVDIEDINRFELDRKDGLISKIFTKNEVRYCFGKAYPAQHLAARFAAKEAVMKAFASIGMKMPAYGDIEVVNEDDGVPKVLIKKKYDVSPQIKLSLSHSKGSAIAFSLIRL